MTPFNNTNQCLDPDTDTFFDFSQLPSPTPSSNVRHASNAVSTISSPTNTAIDADDFQTPAKPSHEYERFKQQTGLPSGSIAGLNGSGYQMFSSTGLDEMSLMGDSMMDGGWNSGLDMGSDMNMNMGMNMDINFAQPAFFFPASDASQSEDFVDPSAIEEPPQVRVWPGMHQQQAQQAALAKARQQQQQQQRQQQAAQQQKQAQQQQNRLHPNRKSASPLTDARTEETIARVVNQIRQNSQNGSMSQSDGQGNLLPHIIRMKKDEEDMDEDERLLASEEGKKLTSKERRQLRNKVSARAFRSRRKGKQYSESTAPALANIQQSTSDNLKARSP